MVGLREGGPQRIIYEVETQEGRDLSTVGVTDKFSFSKIINERGEEVKKWLGGGERDREFAIFLLSKCKLIS